MNLGCLVLQGLVLKFAIEVDENRLEDTSFKDTAEYLGRFRDRS